jgi:hypothetical protein
MTAFQLLCVLLFAGVVLAAYGKDIYSWLKARAPKLPAPAPSPGSPDNPAGDLLVNELLDISALRERLAAAGCKDGAEACSLLLKILIDHKHPHAE